MIVAWVVILGIAIGAFMAASAPLTNSFDIPGTASGAVTDELAEKLPDTAGGTGTVVFRTDDGSALTTEQQDEISKLTASAADLDGVAAVIDPFDAQQSVGRPGAEARRRSRPARHGQRAAREPARSSSTPVARSSCTAQQQLTSAREQAVSAGAPAEQIAAIDAQQAELDAQTASLQQQQDTLDASRTELESGVEPLELGEELLGFASGLGVVSEDGSTAIVNISFTQPRLELPTDSQAGRDRPLRAVARRRRRGRVRDRSRPGRPELFGVGEALGLLFAAIVLIVMLGSLIAASLPIVTALVGVGVGVTASLSFSGVIDMASVTPCSA